MNPTQKRLLRTLWREIDTLNEAAGNLRDAKQRLGRVNPRNSSEWNALNQRYIQRCIEKETRRISIHLATANSLASKCGVEVDTEDGVYRLMQWSSVGRIRWSSVGFTREEVKR